MADQPKKKKVVFKPGGLADKASKKAGASDAPKADTGAADKPAADTSGVAPEVISTGKKKVKFLAGGIAAQAAQALAAKKATTAPKATSAAPAAKPAAAKPAATATGGAVVVAKPSGPAAAAAAAAAKKKATAKKAAVKKPAKPPEPLPVPAQLTSRRSFLEWGIVAWAIFFGWLAGVGHLFLRFMFPRVLYEPDPKFRAGKKSDFPEVGKVYELFKETKAVWLVRLVEEGEDRLVAISTVCTHLGCTPNWLDAEAKFKCPCHGSGFYMTGINFEGPAPRPLERYRMYVDAAGDVIVDRSKKFRDDLNEWGKDESFIKMA